MPKGQAPRISDKSLKKKDKTQIAKTWSLDKARSVPGNKPKWENKDTLKDGMDPKKNTLRRKTNSNGSTTKSYARVKKAR